MCPSPTQSRRSAFLLSSSAARRSVALLGALLWAPFARAQLVAPIAVVEDAKVDRYPPMFSFPIAFSREANVRSLDGFFATRRDGKPLPTQGEVLSRWGESLDGPIRWAYFHVRGLVRPDSRTELELRRDPAVP